MKRLLIFSMTLVTVAIIVGCGRTTQYWYKPDQTQQEFNKDNYECMQQAQHRESRARGAYCAGYYCDPGGAESTVVTNRNLYNACMEARSWTIREK